VIKVLGDLGINERRMAEVCEVWNKTDLLSQPERGVVEQRAARLGGGCVLASAVTGEGLDRLRRRIDEMLNTGTVILDLVVPPADGAGLNWLYENAEVLARDGRDDGSTHVAVRLSAAKADVARKRFRVPGQSRGAA
jgi:GTP-binding protein HflX